MTRRPAIFVAIALLVAVFLNAAEGGSPPPGCFSLWQLPRYQDTIGMSYVIQSPHGHLVVIDGGWINDAPYLKRFLQERGGHVDAWFITHQHDDHMGALTAILPKPEGLRIDRIYASLLSESWIARYAPADELGPAKDFNAALAAAGQRAIQPKLGEEIAIDGLKIEVLSLADENGPKQNPINNACMVLRLSTPGTSVLFLGDLGVEGGQRLLAGPMAGRLRSEYVQMAHHGQNGVGRAVYEAVKARYALWPTPHFLYDLPEPWMKKQFRTAEVRRWMQELGIEKNYVMKDGLIRLDLPMEKVHPMPAATKPHAAGARPPVAAL
jgi:beta-lactamase superfamily II metal-dependent hydrolase